jgi:hypothetical protein
LRVNEVGGTQTSFDPIAVWATRDSGGLCVLIGTVACPVYATAAWVCGAARVQTAGPAVGELEMKRCPLFTQEAEREKLKRMSPEERAKYEARQKKVQQQRLMKKRTVTMR